VKTAYFEVQSWESHLLAEMERSGELNRVSEHRLTLETVSEARGFPAISVFIYSDITAEVINELPDLRLITTRSTGIDHIDLAAAKQKGVVVCNVPDYGANTVAEHAFGMILGLSRCIFAAHTKVLKHDFSLEGLRGFDLKDKTIGVVGAGSIGLHVIRIARGLGMRALAFDVRQIPLIAEVLGFEYVEMDRLLAEAHVVSLHVPLTPQTYHLMNEESLAKMRSGALLINTARGELVDLRALAIALDSGRLGGAGLDVFEGEELIKEESQLLRQRNVPEGLDIILHLLDRPNVILTSHMAFYSNEALERILRTTVENIRAFEAGRPINEIR
jgi:D-lactate dehydrogenase